MEIEKDENQINKQTEIGFRIKKKQNRKFTFQLSQMRCTDPNGRHQLTQQAHHRAFGALLTCLAENVNVNSLKAKN